MIVRPLQRQELETIWTIDRSEVHHHIYRLVDGDLVLTPGYFDLQGWPREQIEQNTPGLYSCFDRGGAFIGMYHDSELVGVAVVDSILFGADSDQLQLKYLYVSQAYRRQGVGTRLVREAGAIAQTRGAAFLYISATPTKNTVDFYRGLGAIVNPTPDPELYALEPDDIHLLCPL